TGRALAGALRRLAPSLRKVGTAVDFHDCPGLGRRRRQIVIQKTEVFERSDRSSSSGAASERSAGTVAPPSGTVAPGSRNDERACQNAQNGPNDESPAQSERAGSAVDVLEL